MPRRSTPTATPASFAVSGGWPDADLAPGAPVEAHAARGFARATRAALDTRRWSLRHAAERAGVTHAALSRVLAGLVYADSVTIARLEATLGRRLWPAPPRKQRPEAGGQGDA